MPIEREFERSKSRWAELWRLLRPHQWVKNLFVAPASLFQNGYLKDVRGFNATTIAIFTLVTATPAGIGLILGGRVADIRGRKLLMPYLTGGLGTWTEHVRAIADAGADGIELGIA